MFIITTLPIIAARTNRLSRLHTIILTPRGVGRNLWRGPPRGGWGGRGGGGTFRWYAFFQRPTFPYDRGRIVKGINIHSVSYCWFNYSTTNFMELKCNITPKRVLFSQKRGISKLKALTGTWLWFIKRTHMRSTWSGNPDDCTTITRTGNNVVLTEPKNIKFKVLNLRR